MNGPEIFVVSAVRTAIGTFGGTLKEVPPTQLATLVTRAALSHANCDPRCAEHVVFGNVIPTSPTDAYISRIAALQAAFPKKHLPFKSTAYVALGCKLSSAPPKAFRWAIRTLPSPAVLNV